MSDSQKVGQATGESLLHKRPPAPVWASLTATFFGTGYLHPGPGTWGSLATMLLWAAISYELPVDWRLPVNVALAALAVAVGIPASTRVAFRN